MGNSGLKQHYETASKTGVLKISNHKLKELPPQVASLHNVLRNLDLSYNRLETFPSDVATFKMLKQLNLSNNKLQELSEAIGNLTKLEMLNASHNSLVNFPESVNLLVNLKHVVLSNNCMKEFPVEFCGLKHLDLLDLSHNKIISVPDTVSDLYATELNMNQNQVSTLSEELAKCPKLKILRLEENCLHIDSIQSSILKDSKIHTLSLDGNLFEAKQVMSLDGYNEYMERFTAMKKKMF